MGRVLERIQVAEKALATLKELAFLEDPSPVERDAAIQRFEYTFEAFWKALQAYLREKEGLRQAPRELSAWPGRWVYSGTRKPAWPWAWWTTAASRSTPTTSPWPGPSSGGFRTTPGSWSRFWGGCEDEGHPL